MAKDTLYPEDDLAPDSGNALAYDTPDEQGIRYPIATPEAGSYQPEPPAPLPEFSPNGGTYVPGSESLPALPGGGYNQAYAADELKQQSGGNPHAVQEAIRLQGLREYEKLIAGGATNAEAMRLAAPKLYFNHPQAMNSAMKFAGTGIAPKVTALPVPGGNAIFDNAGRLHSVLRTPAPPRELKAQMPPDAKVLLQQAGSDVRDVQNQIRTAQKNGADAAELKPLTDALDAARAKQLNLSTNWTGGSKAAEPQSAKLTPDSIRSDFKAGKISRDEAKKLLKDHGFD